MITNVIGGRLRHLILQLSWPFLMSLQYAFGDSFGCTCLGLDDENKAVSVHERPSEFNTPASTSTQRLGPYGPQYIQQ